jgi:hypothetical protein
MVLASSFDLFLIYTESYGTSAKPNNLFELIQISTKLSMFCDLILLLFVRHSIRPSIQIQNYILVGCWLEA